MVILYIITHLYTLNIQDAKDLKGDSETKKLQFFYPEEVPENLMDADLIKTYLNFIGKKQKL